MMVALDVSIPNLVVSRVYEAFAAFLREWWGNYVFQCILSGSREKSKFQNSPQIDPRYPIMGMAQRYFDR